jgi:hypothetical protein
MHRLLLVLPVFVLTILFTQARDDVDLIKVKLEKAKAAFSAEQEKFRQDIDAFFEKREEAARKAGDKKAVDQIKTERKAFDERSELPATAPKAAKQRLATAKTAMERAYALAVKEYTMAKQDEAAALVEKEFQAFTKGLDPLDTRRRWVHEKGTFTRLANGEWEEKSPDGTAYRWKETARTKEYVELHAVIFNVAYTARLGNKTAEYQSGKGAEFRTKFTGKWAD